MSQLRAEKGTGTSPGRGKDWSRNQSGDACKMADAQSANMNGISEQKSPVWSHEEDLKLLEKVAEYLDDVENVFVKDIVWGEVAFDGYNEHDVQNRWRALTSKIRKIRTAKEILEDTKKKVSEKKQTSKKRKREESSQPKRPITAYLLYCEEKRPRFAEKYSTLSATELTKKMAKKWQRLSDEKKAKYKEMYRENRQRFERDIFQYFVEKNPEETPPRSAFDLWSFEKAAEIKKSRPDISEKKLQKKLKKYWERLEEKEEWEQKAKKETEKFIKKMSKKARDKNN